MEYNYREIEKKWQNAWKDSGIYRVENNSDKPKYYVLDMFPYPSGAGLHVGHPLGYIASDIFARYKRLKGFNVLHPMGFDSFGLPAEQYAIETGQHPATTTEKNIDTFKSQLDKIGFSYDWSREIRTSDASYYRWTQWIFLQLFKSWYNHQTDKAEPLSTLIEEFKNNGSSNVKDIDSHFSAEEWNQFDNKQQQDILMQFRLAFSSYGEVNWCEALGTVLANDEVINGVSERGGHPVEKKKMRQWYLRITEYADRLLSGLDTVNFSEAIKEMQRNWIGKSEGAEMQFEVAGDEQEASSVSTEKIKVYTTRPDTIFGVDFLVLAPEHELVKTITTKDQQASINEYLTYVKSRSDRERQSEVKQITGCFTGAYALNPFDGRKIPIWIAEYVLIGYGTGAIMAVPCGDQRDFLFAKHFNIPITNIIGSHYNGEEANPTKDAILENSGFLNGILMKDAIGLALDKIVEKGIGRRKVNYRMRDAGFSRQRYWGEPFPIIWSDGIALPLDADELPLELPHVEKYGPGKEGEGPLSNLKEWVITPNGMRETSTMPGYAGSSWYFLRYMDPQNTETFADRKATDYWNQVDVYIGGTEHAVGHLLYSRLWTKVLFDLGYIGFEEPFKKLVNQGMIQGSSRFVYRVKDTNKLVSYGLKSDYDVTELHVDVNMVDGIELNIAEFKTWRNSEYADAEFILENGKYICGVETEKMSKSKFNTVNPDILVDKYGADTFRMYEMFLGPIEQSKPWDTKGIEGVHRFLKKLWRLFYDDVKGAIWTDEKATPAELKVLHKTIKKIEDDTERFSFNTSVSGFMVAVNELSDLKCHKREVLEALLILLTPYAPHISEELYHALGNKDSIISASFPKLESKYLIEAEKEYPISINGKMRTTITISLDATQDEIENIVLSHETIQKWVEGKTPKKIIYVKGKMVNVVV
ncbi:MAG: leucine--tRNA ligase [Ginsengibacter sp.]